MTKRPFTALNRILCSLRGDEDDEGRYDDEMKQTAVEAAIPEIMEWKDANHVEPEEGDDAEAGAEAADDNNIDGA